MEKKAIVTGAASGIGLQAALDLLAEGWHVFGLDMAAARIEGAPQERFVPMACDVRSADAIAAAMQAISRQADAINALICCAGVLRTGPLATMPIDQFDLIFAVNTRGCWLSARAAMPMLETAAGRGETARIIFLSSVAALRPKVDGGAYAASKAALSQLTRVLAVECAPRGILVNALAPGTVDTPMVRAAADPETAGSYRPSGKSPVGRVAEPKDVTRVISFLLGPDAAYVTGATIPVDGGTSAAFVPPGVSL